MGKFLYFIPGCHAFSNQLIEDYGLEYALAGMPVSHTVVMNGPDNGRGLVICAGEAGSAQIGYHPDRQRWMIEPNERFWVGVENGKLPRPESLVRDLPIGPYEARLGDGNFWMIPTARRYPDGTFLPQNRIYLPGGKIRRDIKEKYREFYLMSDEVAQAFEDGIEMLESRVQEIIEAALKINYRLSHAEIGLLGLIDDDTWAAPLYFIIDHPNWPDSPLSGMKFEG